jgi:hypothetical protein
MSSATKTTDPTSMFSRREARTLGTLRAHYRQHRDLMSHDEVARLRFVRWLYRTGRLHS